MKDALISVVVPVYNVENVLHYCVDSLLEQTYKNLEIILVDDGSSDSSGKICDDYAAKHENIIALHKVNGGQSSARNMGIERASGEYIGFIDSDDWINAGMYQYLYDLIIKYGADIAGVKRISVFNHSCVSLKQPKERILEKRGRQVLQYYMEESVKNGGSSVCLCLFSAKVICGVRFRDGKIYEDIDFKYKVMEKAGIYVESNQIMYYYLQSQSSTSLASFKYRDYELIEATRILVDLSKNESYGSVHYLSMVRLARSSFSLLSRIAYLGFDCSVSKSDRTAIIRDLTNRLRKDYFFLLASPMPVNRKIMMSLICININCLRVPLRIYEKIRLKIRGKNVKLTDQIAH